jgi:two-component system, cell cycle sensor histidine kinase and response regulator CckA
VIFNLVVNARDAMPSGGRLTIDTSNATLDTDYTRRYLGVGPGEYILLAVTDTGSGMPPEVLAHVFEPFFTTKTVGKGTGLGLSTCYGIVTQSGGYILPYSEVGRGTTFKVYLPRVDAASDADGDERATNVLPRGSETVLVVEDEAMLREFVRRVLAGQGYTVLEAADGEEALRVLGQEPPGSVALVVTDMVMPKLGGAALAQRVARAAPATRIVLMSGYMDSVMGGDEALPPGTFFLQKPFSAIALAQKVRMALDQLGGAD